MKPTLSSLAIVLILATASKVTGEELASDYGSSAMSLREMISSGRAKVANSTPEAKEKLIEAVEVRKKIRQFEVEIFRKTERILSQIKDSADSQNERRVVKIEPVDGGAPVVGTLIDYERGLVVTSLEGLKYNSGEVRVTVSGGKEYSSVLRVLSEKQNLAFINLGEAVDFGVGKYSVENESWCDLFSPLVPGAFLGTEAGGAGWVLGSVTSLNHFDESETDSVVRNSLGRHWEHSDIPISERRTNFDGAVVCDLPISANLCGGPVYNSRGGFVGVLVSRTDQHEAILIPVFLIENLLSSRA